MHIGVKKTIKILSLPILSSWQTLHILISAVAQLRPIKLALVLASGPMALALASTTRVMVLALAVRFWR